MLLQHRNQPEKNRNARNKREAKGAAIRKKSRKKNNKLEPTPIAKAKEKEPKEDNEKHGPKSVGKGSWPSKKDSDYEHAGEAIAIHKRWANSSEEVKEINKRTILLRFKGAGGISLSLLYMRPQQTARKVKRVNSTMI